MSLQWVPVPEFPPNVRVAYSTRSEGVSAAPYASFNIASHVGDDADAVEANRRLLASQLPFKTDVAWLSQVHSDVVVEAMEAFAVPPDADGVWTSRSGLACAVMTADCLPVLLADRAGTCVAAVHAGWRGLAAGVIDAAVSALPVPPEELAAYLGPAIGPTAFEVGAEVRNAFLAAFAPQYRAAVDACFSGPSSERWMADLTGLARLRLQHLGVAFVHASNLCTYADATRFFSYRRDGVTGRNVSLVLRL